MLNRKPRGFTGKSIMKNIIFFAAPIALTHALARIALVILLIGTLYCTGCQNLSGPWIGGVATGEQTDLTNPPRPQMSVAEAQQNLEALVREHEILPNPASVRVSPNAFSFIFPNNSHYSYNLADINSLSIKRAGDFLTSLYGVQIGPRRDILCNSYQGAHRLLTTIAALKYYSMQEAGHQAQNPARNAVTPPGSAQNNPESAPIEGGRKNLPNGGSPNPNIPTRDDSP
jgi:hypothetical protein